MRFKSITTRNPNPFRLGVEIGDELREVQPEVILIFASMEQSNFSEIYNGIRETYVDNCPIVIGGTGDGVYESEGVSEGAVVALAINSDKKIKWHAASEEISGHNSYRPTQDCLEAIKDNIGDPDYIFLLSDFRADGTQIVKCINENSQAVAFGGFASDDRKMNGAFTSLNGETFSNHIITLGMKTDEKIYVFNGSGYKPKGTFGIVTSSDGPIVKEINHKSPLVYIEEQLGKKVSHIDKGILAFNISSQDNDSETYLRSVSNFKFEKDELILFGGVPEDSKIQICTADSTDIVSGVEDILSHAREEKIIPSASVIISCAGRKWLLGNKIDHEVSMIKKILGNDFPIAGFPSLGEISPVFTNGSFSNHFHNVTYVLAVFGKKK